MYDVRQATRCSMTFGRFELGWRELRSRHCCFDDKQVSTWNLTCPLEYFVDQPAMRALLQQLATDEELSGLSRIARPVPLCNCRVSIPLNFLWAGCRI